jgi:hypothetical protein
MDRKLKLLGQLEPNFAGMMFVRSSMGTTNIICIMFQINWASSLRGEDFFKASAKQKKELPMVTML